MNDLLIFVLNGPAGVGKDTFVTYVDNYLRNTCSKKAVSLSSVGGIKHIASEFFGYKESVKSDKDRKFLADLKNLTDEYCDYSFTYIKEQIESMKNSNNSGVFVPVGMVFIMCREPDKIAKIVSEYHAKTIFIDTNREIHQVTNNASDKNVRDFHYDIIIHNNKDLNALCRIANTFVDTVNGNENIREYY